MKLVLLDRDGVINQENPDQIRNPDDWLPIEGSLEAITKLNQLGYRVVIVSNQSGIGLGLFTVDELHAIHQKMHDALSKLGGHVDAVLYCPHASVDECNCRKPRPGLLHDVAKRLNMELVNVPVVGDSLRDLQAAMAVGAQPVLVRTGKGQLTLEENPALAQQIQIFDDLASFVEYHTNPQEASA